MAKRLRIVKPRMVGASPLRRILAFLADIAVLNLIIGIPFGGLISSGLDNLGMSQTYEALSQNPALVERLMQVYLIVGLLAFAYFTISESITQQSVGKMLLGLYVVSGENKPSVWQVMGRNLFLIPIFPFVLLWIADPIAMLFSGGHLRISDRLTRTRVVCYESGLRLR